MWAGEQINYKTMKILNLFRKDRRQATKKTVNYEFMEKAPDRTQKDLAAWRQAVKMAETPEIRRRYLLYDIYTEQLDVDAHLFGILRKRTDKISSLEIVFERNGKIDESMSDFLNADKFRQFLRDLHETIYWGFSLFEFSVIKDSKGTWFDYFLLPRKHVEPHTKKVLRQQYDNDGMSYTPLMEGSGRTVAESGDPDDLGLLKTAVIYSLIKRNAISDWGSYSEKAGRNFELVKYKRGDEHLRNQIMSALENAQAGGVVGLPEGVEIEMKSGGSANHYIAFDRLIQWCNEEQSKLVLGNVMTTDSGSSRAQAEVHSGEQNMIELADREMVLNYLNYIFWDYLPLWGINPTNGVFMLKDTMRVADEIEKDLKLKALGYNFTPEQIAKKYGLE